MPQILPIAVEHVSGFREALGSVARERTYLALIDAPPLEWAIDFVGNNIKKGYAQFIALEEGHVVGWCDIIPSARPGFGHSGSVGMGVLQGWRQQGLGKKLLEACIQKSIENGLTRIELEVYASNTNAIALYRRLGFVEEGLKRRARFLDGKYQDLLIMALLCESA
jgi:ribosomal protein S18 acetylase RimI-like enzyme